MAKVAMTRSHHLSFAVDRLYSDRQCENVSLLRIKDDEYVCATLFDYLYKYVYCFYRLC